MVRVAPDAAQFCYVMNLSFHTRHEALHLVNSNTCAHSKADSTNVLSSAFIRREIILRLLGDATDATLRQLCIASEPLQRRSSAVSIDRETAPIGHVSGVEILQLVQALQ